MIRFTRYAEQKFELLQSYKVFLTREQVEEAATAPDKTTKKGRYAYLEKEGLTVVARKDSGILSIVTFFPNGL